MAINICKDLQFNENVKAVYFDGTSTTLSDLKKLIAGSNLNLNTLHTKIGFWCVKYKDGSIVWKKQKCFSTGFQVIR